MTLSAFVLFYVAALVAAAFAIYWQMRPSWYAGQFIVINGQPRMILDYVPTRRVMTITGPGTAVMPDATCTLTFARVLP